MGLSFRSWVAAAGLYALASLALMTGANAQMFNQASEQALSNQISTLRNILAFTVEDMREKLGKYEVCARNSMIYAPNHEGSDVSGCVKVNLGRTECPDGFTLIGESGSAEAFCISAHPEALSNWVDAADNCYRNFKAHLCTAAEWISACSAGIGNMKGPHVEWVAGVVGNKYGAALIGGATCASTMTNAAHPYQAYSRCCLR